jgi:catechol 2,3-dioxygenase-like lactoylglutathione lyase family enzyme
MKAIPIIRVKDMRASLVFYTKILDFQVKYPGSTFDDPVVTLVNGNAELLLSICDGVFGSPIYIRVEYVDRLFGKYLARGLDTSKKKESPVHQAPIDQTWGMREFYVNDPDGNTLRFCMPITRRIEV